MNHSQNEANVMESWRRCAQAGLPMDSENALYPLSPQALQELYKKRQSIIASFERCVSPIITCLPKSSALLLTDVQGILLKKNPQCAGI